MEKYDTIKPIKIKKEAYKKLFSTFNVFRGYVFVCTDYKKKELNIEDMKYYEKYLCRNFQRIYKARKDYTLNRRLDKTEPM